MSVDTKTRLDGKVTFESILDWLKTNIDSNAYMNPYKKSYFSNDTANKMYNLDHEKYDEDSPYYISNYIYFKHKNTNMNLFVYYTNINTYENLKYFTKCGLADMVKQETTHIIIPYCENGVEISHMLATYYGGWVEDNDCSDLSYVRFDKGSDTPKPIRHVTLEDVYKAFGEVVIIDDYILK